MGSQLDLCNCSEVELDDLRIAVRAFLSDVSIDHTGDRVERAKAWRRSLADAGLVGIDYPTEYGGQGLSAEHDAVFRAEMVDRTPDDDGLFGIGLGMVGPTLLEHGSPELCQRFLPPLLRGEEIWCQLYSEPGAGSDLASLQARAVLDGEEWILNGQKVWTSGAVESDMGLAIVRTDVDVPKHAGITMMLVPMNQPGVTVRPLVQMTNVAHFNEVFFDDTRVPADWVIGGVNNGWAMAKALLAHERRSLGRGGGRQPAPFELVLDHARRAGRTSDPVDRHDLVSIYVGERVARLVAARQLHPSIGKLWRTKQGRAAAAVLARMAFAGGTAWSPDDEPAADAAYRVLDAPAMSIGGGTDEVQKNTLGERVLGLPREPSVDRDIPFRQLKVGTQR